MTNKVETKPVPNRVLRDFGSDKPKNVHLDEPTITPENLEAHAESLPRPTGYRILILPFTQSTVTKGGIHLAKATVDKERLATVVGYVVAAGPDAYSDPHKFPDGAWCKEGDWVVFRAYSGTRMKMYGQEFRLINDDTVEAVVDDPTGVVRA